MRYTASILVLLVLGLGEARAMTARPIRLPLGPLVRRDSDSYVSGSGVHWRPDISQGWYYLASSGSGGKFRLPTIPLHVSAQSLSMGTQSASAAENAQTTEVITIPNGGISMGGNGATGGSIFVNHGEVVGTPSTTETILSSREIGGGMMIA